MPFAYIADTGKTVVRLRAECEAAKRREGFTGKTQWVCLPPGVELPGVVLGKRRYARVAQVEAWLEERKGGTP